MATVTVSGVQDINLKTLFIGAFVSIASAGAFILLLANMMIGSQVAALQGQLVAMQTPATVNPATQSNSLPVTTCTDTSLQAGSTGGSSAGSTSQTAAPWQQNNGGPLFEAGRGGVSMTGWRSASPLHTQFLLPSASYSQSNVSNQSTDTHNTYINDSYNSSNRTSTFNNQHNNGNTVTLNNQHNNGNTTDSGNSVTLNNQHNNGNNYNSGNTSNTTVAVDVDNAHNNGNTVNNQHDNGNTVNSSNTFNNQHDNGNTVVTNSGNTSNTSQTTDNSNSSTNVSNSGNTSASSTTNNTDNSNNSVNSSVVDSLNGNKLDVSI